MSLPISVKTAKNKVNRITFAVTVIVNSLMLMSRKATRMKLNENVREMYVNGMGFRAIERVKKVHHTTVINWVRQVGNSLPSAPEYSEIPEVAELDELETFVGSKKTRFGARSAVNHGTAGILAWVIGESKCRDFHSIMEDC